jgi:hypothetical protein
MRCDVVEIVRCSYPSRRHLRRRRRRRPAGMKPPVRTGHSVLPADPAKKRTVVEKKSGS